MAVNLEKGQKISLAKQGGELSEIFMGLGWDAARPRSLGGFFGKFVGRGSSIDLDASCVMFDESKQPLDIVFFNSLTGANGAVRHTGDNLTGEGDGDDEVIEVSLERLPENVCYLVFTVNSYRGQTFDEVDNAFCRLVDKRAGQELARYSISGGGPHTAMIMAKIYRHGGEWKMHAIGEPMTAKTATQMVEPIRKIL